MGLYRASCNGFGGVLNGTLEINNGQASDYRSIDKGTGQTTNNGGNPPNILIFRVKFNNDPHTYPVAATQFGNGYRGTANDHLRAKGKLNEEPWTATIVPVPNAKKTGTSKKKAASSKGTKKPPVSKTTATSSKGAKKPTVTKTKAASVKETKKATVSKTKAASSKGAKKPTVSKTKAASPKGARKPSLKKTGSSKK